MRVAQTNRHPPHGPAQRTASLTDGFLDIVHRPQRGGPEFFQIRLHLCEPAPAQQLRQRRRRALSVSPRPRAALGEQVVHHVTKVQIKRHLGVINHGLPDPRHRFAHLRVRVVLHPEQFREQLLQVRRERVARALRDGREPERRAFGRVQHGLVVRQVHELVNQIGLPDVSHDGAQFLVRVQRPAAARARAGGFALLVAFQRLVVHFQRAFREHGGVIHQFYPSSFRFLPRKRSHQRRQQLLALCLRAELVNNAHPAAGHLLRKFVRVAQQRPKRLLDLGEHGHELWVLLGVRNKRQEPGAGGAPLFRSRRVQVGVENRTDYGINHVVVGRGHRHGVDCRRCGNRRRRVCVERVSRPGGFPFAPQTVASNDVQPCFVRPLQTHERPEQHVIHGGGDASEGEAQRFADRELRFFVFALAQREQPFQKRIGVHPLAPARDDVASRTRRALRRAFVCRFHHR
mmetsp:Transcript_15639/g.51336  ORF Transcript_15639/g.51336 Transcript_15639/m.51336 type:complete len:459 (-) Transcript_15639:57-1433(-)